MKINNNSIVEAMSADKLIRLSLIQTAILFFGSVIVFNIFLFLYVAYEIVPFLIMFTLFNISCNERNRKFQKIMIFVFAVVYIVMVIFASSFFIDLFMMVTISSSIVSYSYVKFMGGGKKDYFWLQMPVIITVVQFIMMFLVMDSFTNLYREAKIDSAHIWQKYSMITSAIFLVSSLITNYSIFIWRKWWIPVLGVLGIVVLSVYVFLQGKYFDMVVPQILILFYALGVIVSFVVDLRFSGFDFKEWFNRARHFKYRWLTRREFLLITMPIVITVIQIGLMYLMLDKNTNLYQKSGSSESLYVWYNYNVLVTSLLIVFATIANFAVFVWRKWWIPVLGVLGIVALSVYVFLQGRYFDMVVPQILILSYVLGGMISYLVGLSLVGFDFKVWFRKICSKNEKLQSR